jgi:putative transferase (TIGR04331 family)
MSIQLVTSSITDFWPDSHNLLLLGEWCITHSNYLEIKARNSRVFPYHFNNINDINEAYVYCTTIYEAYLQKLADILNHIHGNEEDLKYWRIIVGPWLFHYIQVMYDRYLSASRVLAQYPDLEVVGLDPENFQINYYGREAIRAGVNEMYNLQLFTQIFLHLGARVSLRVPGVQPPKDGPPPPGSPGFLRNLFKQESFSALFVRDFSFLLQRGQVWSFMVYMPWRLLARIVISTKLRVCPLEQVLYPLEQNTPASPDQGLRSELANLLKFAGLQDQPFCALLTALIPENLPIVYLEGYAPLCRQLQVFRDHQPRALISAIGYLASDPWKFLAAAKAKTGTRLIGMQHGGVYGTARLNPVEDHEHRVTDQWWSWGWTKNGVASVRPLPNPKLSILHQKIARVHDPGEYLLIAVNTLYRHLYRLGSEPVGSLGKFYREWLVRFLASVGNRIPVVLRLFYDQDDLGQAEHIKEKFPWVTLDDWSITYYDRLKKARLVVADSNITVYLESLAAGKPTIIFWDPHFWEFRPEAEPYLQLLKAAKVFFDSPEAAAAHALAVFKWPEEWWASPSVQKARDCFVSHYALTSEDWLAQWRQTINRLIGNRY